MTLTIPTVPSLPAGYIVQAADLNALAACATFLMNKPIARVHDGAGGQSLIGSTYTPITFNTVDVDTDTMYSAGSPTLLTVQTPGFYTLRYAVSINSITHGTYCTVTTGAGNPLGSGITLTCWGGYSIGNTASCAMCGGLLPAFMYAGDTVKVGSVPNTGAVTTLSNVVSFMSLEYVST